MPIPDFQTLMLPILQLAGDGQLHKLRDAVAAMSDAFNLTEAERNEMIGSRLQPRIYSNVSWAVTYLRAARLLESPLRGTFRITDRGYEVLSANPKRIDVQYLKRFPEFVEFYAAARADSRAPSAGQGAQMHEPPAENISPDERLEISYRELQKALARDLLERIKHCSPRFFENLVIDLLVKMGYGGSVEDAGKAIGRSGDGGIDGVIKGDILGLDEVYVQAKRWEGAVGTPVVRDFVGALEGRRARRGVLITTSSFTDDARRYVERIEKKIVLIDGEQLAQYMIDFNVGVAEERRYVIKRLDENYFSGDA
ncbi:MAG: restriction endonuclease [Chloroflexi bacterium]|nr:restriction endonuclease [Chloroflexota bacterium]